MWLLFYCHSLLMVVSLCSSLFYLAAYIYACYLPRASLRARLPVYCSVEVCAFLLCLGVSKLTRRVRGLQSGLECAMGFVNIYGPGAPRAKRYGWLGAVFGAVGTIVGFLCGIAILLLPLAALSYRATSRHR
ncbi:hypothetical protein EI94DRAFT_1752799 [Lactarius quietus]|nr:hypothetical protein EI94DRAFT_1752799 [Lactarius quietus]